MARIRSIRPEFWEDPTIGRLSRDARLLYIGLWNMADDEGRFRWNLRRIVGELFSFDADADVEAWMRELTAARRVVRYSIDGEDLAFIPTFKEYQKPNRPTGSKLPEPTEESLVTTEDSGLQGSLMEDSLSPQEVLPPVVGEGVVEGEVEGGDHDLVLRAEVEAEVVTMPGTSDYFAALEEAWKQPTPKGPELGKWTAAVKAMREAEVYPDEVGALYDAFVQTFPTAAVTPTAIVNHVGRLREVIRGGGITRALPEPKAVARADRIARARAIIENIEGRDDES